MTRKEIIAISVAGLALLSVAFSVWGGRPPIERKIHTEIAKVLAFEAMRLLKPGGKVTLIARDTDAFEQPGMEMLIAGLEDELRDNSIEIRSIELIALDPIRPCEVPPGDFYELLRRRPEGDVIISLLGPPFLLPEHQQKLGRPKAGVVALCIGNLATHAKVSDLLRVGLLHAAIINKVTPEKTPVRSFDSIYGVRRAAAAI